MRRRRWASGLWFSAIATTSWQRATELASEIRAVDAFQTRRQTRFARIFGEFRMDARPRHSLIFVRRFLQLAGACWEALSFTVESTRVPRSRCFFLPQFRILFRMVWLG